MILGRAQREHDSFDLRVDLPRLLETRMLVQANSGGGKSFLLRRLLEQTAKEVQQIVIDPEGEFATLREKFDYIIAAPHDADVVANPKTAALLARRLLETGVSAVVDIYDLKAGERQAFVRRFLDALVNAPRKVWHPVLLVVDEAHVYCPQVGSSEAAPAVIDVCTRGRKRGLCAVLATQRLAKLHKDAAAEMLNKLIGRTGLDVDVKRAADELGMTAAAATQALRALPPGTFYAFGPSLNTAAVTQVAIGPVVTTHPQSGQRLMAAPPAPTARIRESLAKLSDLQQQADQEAQDLAAAQARVRELERELRAAQRAQPAPAAAPPPASARPAKAGPEVEILRKARPLVGKLAALFDVDRMEVSGSPTPISIVALRQPIERAQNARAAAVVSSAAAPAVDGLRSGAVKILQQLAARVPAGYSRVQVGALTGFSHKGGTFNTYLSDLRKRGLIEERDKLVYATEAGIVSLGNDVPAAPATHEEVMALWRTALRSGAVRILEAVVEAGKDGLSREQIADAVGMERKGGTFNTYLSDLRRNGLISERGGLAYATDILFPEAGRG
jgi:hypothetical protein